MSYLIRKSKSDKAISPVIGTVLLIGLTVALISLTTFILFDISDDVNDVPNSDVEITDDNEVQLINKENADKVIVRENNTEYELSTGELYKPESNEYSVIAIINNQETLLKKGMVSEQKEECSISNLTEVFNNMRGDGTVDNPYRISNVCELQAMSEDLTANYEIIKTINATKTESWNDGTGFRPIGNTVDTDGFTGTLDGNNYKIDDLYINRSNPTDDYTDWDSEVGLFSVTDGANISNLSILNSDIESTERTGGLIGLATDTSINKVNINNVRIESTSDSHTGGIVGYGLSETSINNSKTENIHITGMNKAGGIIGETDGIIKNTYSEGTIEGEFDVGGIVGYAEYNLINEDINNTRSKTNIVGYQNVGGIVGYFESDTSGIMSSVSHGEIIANNKYAGGIMGYSQTGGHITDSFSTMDVEAGEIKAGGVGGYISSDVINSYATGDIETMNGRGTSGGLIGATIGAVKIENSYAEGNVNTTESNTGGLVGYLDGNSQIINSHAKGDVHNEDNNVGGLVGEMDNDSSISNSYATGNATSTGGQYVGGLVGEVNDESTISNSYATGEVNGNLRSGGLVGHVWNFAEITNSYATGDVTVSESTGGGLIGRLYENSSVEKSYATGDVTVNDGNGNFAGGLIAFSHEDTSIEESYSTGLIQADGDHVGGYIGELRGESTVGYWDTESSTKNEGIGVLSGSDNSEGLTTNEMQGDEAVANMNGFNFDTTWNIVVDPDDYPELD